MGHSTSHLSAESAAAATAVQTEEICSDATLRSLVFTTTPAARVPIVYTDKYNIGFFGLEKLHPFDAAKYEKIFNALTSGSTKLLHARDFFAPIEAPRSVLRLIHPAEYLDTTLKSSVSVARILEVPPVAALPNAIVQSKALTPMRYATGGTLLGAELAMRTAPPSDASSSAAAPSVPRVPPLDATVTPGWAINLSGGYHHCSAHSGGGFCAFGDISLALLVLAKKFDVKRAMIVDLDAHQGNGHENDKRNGVFSAVGLQVFILDMFNSGIYPHDLPAQKAIDCPVRLRSGTKTDEYLRLLRQHLTASLNQFQPEFIIYNAGTDCLAGDPLGLLDISAEGIVERDRIVFSEALERKIPLLMLLSGGYQKSNAGVIASSIANLHATLGLWQLDDEIAKERERHVHKKADL